MKERICLFGGEREKKERIKSHRGQKIPQKPTPGSKNEGCEIVVIEM